MECDIWEAGGALAYARGRHTSDGHVDRSRRQQKLILAIRDKMLKPELFPSLMAEAPQLYNTFQAGIHTNMSLDQAIRLAALVSTIPADRIQQGLIDNHMVNFGNVTLGGQNASILMPIPDKIRELRDQIFTVGGPTSPIAPGDPKALMQADGARVEVTSNTHSQPGIADRQFTSCTRDERYGSGTSDGPGGSNRRGGLCSEAVFTPVPDPAAGNDHRQQSDLVQARSRAARGPRDQTGK